MLVSGTSFADCFQTQRWRWCHLQVTGTHTSVAMANVIHSQNPIGSSPTSTCEWLHHNTNKRQILLISALIFHFILVVFFCPLPPQSTSCMELYWPDVVCLGLSCDSNTTLVPKPGNCYPGMLWRAAGGDHDHGLQPLPPPLLPPPLLPTTTSVSRGFPPQLQTTTTHRCRTHRLLHVSCAATVHHVGLASTTWVA